MALGVYGSTLTEELNRIANGGTYPPVGEMVDPGEATRQIAAIYFPSVTITTTEVVGMLNEMAGNVRPRWYDLAYVCNQLAATTGLEAAEALRTVQLP
jgi:hypothetical protein